MLSSLKNCKIGVVVCLTQSVVYNANVTTESDTTGKNYIGLTEGTFKQRYTQHKLSFRNRNYSNSTELSKHIWTLKDNNTNFTINWSILATAPAYSNKSKRCHSVCLTEKLYLIRANKPSLLNKRSELISKCRHEKTLRHIIENLKKKKKERNAALEKTQRKESRSNAISKKHPKTFRCVATFLVKVESIQLN